MHILHNVIGSPRLQIKSASKTLAVLTVTPLPAGYGMTLGNALRRVLLSSLPGTAVTAIKIDGVTHEYTTVKGLKDSVLDITLNIRELKLKKHTKGVEEVGIAFQKSGNITAGDLKVSSDIEILDPSQVITSCDGVDTKKKITLRVEKGVGYQLVSNEDSVQEGNPEWVLIDANFSPVVSVKYEVTPARVGEQTNLDQLILQVETNGGLEAEKAIKLSATILESYFALFNNEDAYSDEEFTTSFDLLKQQRAQEEAATHSSPAGDTSFTPIDALGLSQRTLNALVNGGITSVEQLIETPMVQLVQLRGFGSKAKEELKTVLAERGYTVEMDSDSDNE